jgi:hypothetical protein
MVVVSIQWHGKVPTQTLCEWPLSTNFFDLGTFSFIYLVLTNIYAALKEMTATVTFTASGN